MKTTACLFSWMFTLLLASCHNHTKTVQQNPPGTAARDDREKGAAASPGFKVSGYLIFRDGTLSSFDVLNDSTIVLWNTVIGEGDALKPSNKTKLVVQGNLDGLTLTVQNGRKKVLQQALQGVSSTSEFIIDDTGCNDVKVLVTKADTIRYNHTIEFHCGE